MKFSQIFYFVYMYVIYGFFILTYAFFLKKRGNVGKTHYDLLREFGGKTKYIIVRRNDFRPLIRFTDYNFKVMGGVNSVEDYNKYISLKTMEEVVINV